MIGRITLFLDSRRVQLMNRFVSILNDVILQDVIFVLQKSAIIFGKLLWLLFFVSHYFGVAVVLVHLN